MALIHMNHYSLTLGRNAGCYIILPQDSLRVNENGESVRAKVPVLWLLHGGSDDHTTWLRQTSIERYVAPLGMAAVILDAENSAYANMAHGGQFHDYITKELPSIMHTYYGFSTAREDNYICGLSMGGDGALKLGLANPEIYSVIGCLSAGIFNPDIPDNTEHLDYLKQRELFLSLQGKPSIGSEERAMESAKRILEEGKPIPRIFHSIGDDDHCMWAARRTRAFFESFEGNPFDYTYEQHPGRHNWDYWDEHIRHFLQFVRKT